ncbi:phage head morphogenesis protein [Psychrobacter lutiphocae]|uniref:phage head morphogenesis protein n=1 Tax=Psychrobacter lutiphocae TaxID=540500 RepID=UPI0003622C6B|nr:phage minor head protein [Psychrobacter lutiphocae]
MSDKDLANVQAAFKLPFAEQIAFYQQKLRLPTQSYKDLQAHQHDKAFVVAGAMKADLLKDLQDAVAKAIEDGESLGQFKSRFDEIVAKRGWLTDTDKEYKAWRARIVYLTNLRSSHAAGRWQQMRTPEMMAARPYWQYRHTTLDNPRLNHKRLNGKVLPADDGWWSINYPPNGYGCNCYVRALSRKDVERLGLSVAKTPDYDGADDSFAHAPGSSWYPDLDKYSYAIAKAMVADGMANGVFERWIARMNDQRDELVQSDGYKGLSSLDKNRLIRQADTGEKYAVAVINPSQKQILDVKTQTIWLSEYDALKQAQSRAGNHGFDASSYHKVQRVIDNATLIVRQIHKPTGDLSKRTLWVEGFIDGKTSRYSAVLHQTADGKEVYLKSYRLDSTKDKSIKKRGEVLFEK